MRTSFRFTVDDLEEMPDKEGTRYEIIDGELYVSTAPHIYHQMTCDEASSALREWSRQTQLGWPISAPGVIFAPDDAVIPDVVWVRRDRMAEVVDYEDGKFHGAPDLVVEVLSPGAGNEERDRERKLDLYARWHVPEYWLLDWRRRIVQVYRREEDALRLAATLKPGDTLTSPLLPGFSVDVGQFFPRSI